MFGVRRALLASTAVTGGGGGPAGPIGTPVSHGMVYVDGPGGSISAPTYTNTVPIYGEDLVYFLPIGFNFSSTPDVTDNHANTWAPSQTNAYGAHHVTPYFMLAPGTPGVVTYGVGELEITADFHDPYEYLLDCITCSGIKQDLFDCLDGPALNADFFAGQSEPSLDSGGFTAGPLQELAIGMIVYQTGGHGFTEADGWTPMGTDNMGGGGSNIQFGLAARVYNNSDGHATYNPTFDVARSPILCLDVFKGAAT